MNDLKFEDDEVVIVAKNAGEIIVLSKDLWRESKKVGLNINWEKKKLPHSEFLRNKNQKPNNRKNFWNSNT